MTTPYVRMPALAQFVGGLSAPLRFLMAAMVLAVLAQSVPADASADQAVQLPKGIEQSVTVSVLPPISQPGAQTASPAQARTVVVAEVRPKLAGRPVVLQRRQDGAWKSVNTTRMDTTGRVEFTAASRVGGRTATYRVRAKAYDGLPGVPSQSVKTNAWGQPSFVEEFGGQALSSAWSHRGQAYNPWGGREGSKGDPAAVAVGGGALRLSVLADPARTGELFTATDPEGNPTGTYAYRLNGHVSTDGAFAFKYGVAAARMKFQHPRGQHASFWMQPQGGLTVGAEIDVVEWYGTNGVRQRMATNIYPHPAYEENDTWFGGTIAKPDRFLKSDKDSWWTAYHVFSVEWTPTEYVFRIDGRESMRTTHGVSHDPEFLILSMLSSDYELGHLGGDQNLPQHAYVDWVQVWPQR